MSGFTVKLLSAAYRIPLTRMMGANLMGHYSSVLNVFMPFFSLATAGIIPTVSRFTAQLNAQGDADGIYRLSVRALKLYISLSAAAGAAYLMFSKIYARNIGEEIFLKGAMVLLPCIAMGAAEMVFKGIVQGKMQMHITAAANITESIVKTALGIVLVWFALYHTQQNDRDMPVIACLAANTASSFVCFAFLAVAGRQKPTSQKNKNTVHRGGSEVSQKQLISMSAPICASAVVASLVSFFDTAVCLPIIKNIPYAEITKSFENASFMGADEISMYLFGIWQGMVLTVFNLVPAVLASVGTACLPVLTRAYSSKDKTCLDRQVTKLFEITAFFSIPAAVFVFLFRTEIMVFLFGVSDSQAAAAAQLLAVIIPFCPFACFVSAFNSVIHAHGKSKTVFVILAASSAAKCAVSAVGCSIPSVNIKALAVSSALFYTTVFVLSAVYLIKLNVRIDFARIFTLPVIASALTAFVLVLLKAKLLLGLPVSAQLLLAGTIFVTVYILVTVGMGFTVDI